MCCRDASPASRSRSSRLPMRPRRIAPSSRARPSAPPCWCPDMDLNAIGRAPRDNGYLFSRGQAWFAFGMTLALMIFDYVDRQIIVSLFPYLKAEWSLSDKQLGGL